MTLRYKPQVIHHCLYDTLLASAGFKAMTLQHRDSLRPLIGH